jgi:aryl-alcohol dehydrogenase-like predicted oxidoreductase
MSYRSLGQTGMQVSNLCLGAMMFGGFGNRDHDECVRIVHRALDAGINFVDTADVYSAGESEEILAKALTGGRRDDIILATKCHFPVATGPFDADRTPNTYGSSRRHIIRSCEDSLRRLGTDWIDLYQMHRPDYTTDVDETLGALSDLIHQGKVRAIGSSTFPSELIVEAQWTAERRSRERFRCEQPPYSIFVRLIERDLLPVCLRYGMGVIVWGPLNGGWLSGKYRRDSDAAAFTSGRARRFPDRFDPSQPDNVRKLDLVEELDKLAGEAGMSLPHLALAWTLEHPAVTSTIVGPRTMEHLEGLLGADERRVPVEVLDRIDELVPPGTAVRSVEDPFVPPWLTDASQRRRPAAAD